MAEPIRCYLLRDTNCYRKSLRRYRSSWHDGKEVPELKCPATAHYHDASAIIVPQYEQVEPQEQPSSGDDENDVPHTDPRWPVECVCREYRFSEIDVWQINNAPLYQRSDTGELVTLHDALPGAIWNAHWMPDTYKGPDGRCLVCRTPGGDWMLDSRASNCTRPGEPHQCWVRHGEPPDLHVDKDGDTCAAGAGSIMVGTWHGFLHRGYLVQC